MLEVLRKELKYSVSRPQAVTLAARLATVMQPDSHNSGGGYRVRSLYFDTPWDDDFEEKVNGTDARQKIRLRIYGTGSTVVKLELKEKTGTAQRKRSLLLSEQEARRMLAADYAFLAGRPENTAHQLYLRLTTKAYRPKCIVEYDRTAFLCAHNDTRITFDAALRATEANLDLFDEKLLLYPVCSPGALTLEVKYNHFLLTSIKGALGETQGMQESSSKYCRARTVTKKGRH